LIGLYRIIMQYNIKIIIKNLDLTNNKFKNSIYEKEFHKLMNDIDINYNKIYKINNNKNSFFYFILIFIFISIIIISIFYKNT